MNKSKADKILKTGTTRQKIKLYMEDVALLNTPLDHSKALLTEEQRASVIRGLNTPGDLKHYEKLGKYNKAFLLFRPWLMVMVAYLDREVLAIHSLWTSLSAESKRNKVINRLLDTHKDPKSRANALFEILPGLSPGAEKHQENGLDYVRIPKGRDEEAFKSIISNIEGYSETVRSYANTLRHIVGRPLPLKPYRDLLKDQEREVVIMLKKAQTAIFFTEKLLDSPTRTQLKPYEDLSPEVTKEDLEELEGVLGL